MMREDFETAIDVAVNKLGQRIAEIAVTDVEYRDGLQFAIAQLTFALQASEELSAIEDESRGDESDESDPESNLWGNAIDSLEHPF